MNKEYKLTESAILYSDNHLLIVNKPSGISVQADNSGELSLDEMVKWYIKEKYQKPGNVFAGVVHRIDKPVTGIVIFARNSRSLARVNELFKERKMRKVYWAVVKDQPPVAADTLTHWLKKDGQKNITKAFEKEVPGAAKSWLDYETLGQSDQYCLLKVVPHTGRQHQIRVQLSKMGCAIKGDVKYGARRGNEDRSIHLHAREISFEHPAGKGTIHVVAPVPDEALWKYFEKAMT
ncbi:MAG: tRNA pseudouridine synthase [Bacteroidota bacterium]|jgi:23S rRNA pseudouridine1911/1915/1917 synthase